MRRLKIKKRYQSVISNLMTVAFAFMAMGLLALMALRLTYLGPVAHTMQDFSLSDVYYLVQQEYGTPDTSRVVTIVDMTDLPDRAAIAQRLEELVAMKPKVVGVDIVFEGLKPDTASDLHLMQLSQDSTLVFAYRAQHYADEATGYAEETHSFFAEFLPVNEGFTNFERQLYGGLKRNANLQLRINGEDRSSLVGQVATRYADGQLPLSGAKTLAVNWRPTVFRTVPADSVAFYPELIEDRVVIYGAAHELADIHYTPLGEMAGVELLAYSVQTLVYSTEEKHLSGWLTALISFLLVLVTHLGKNAYLAWAKSRPSQWFSFFLTTTFLVGLLLSLWTILLVWLGYLVFYLTGYSVNLGWGLAAIPFLSGSAEFYGLTIRHFGGFKYY